MRKIILGFLTLLLTLATLAQTEVSGVVKDNQGQSIPGAAVLVKGTTDGTITDMDGRFSLIVKKDAILIISFLGFIPQEIPVNGQSTINIELLEDTKELEEVVVVGYGSVRKSDLTGAVSSVKVEDNVARQATTVDQLLQGRAAGVQVTGGGQPGSGISVRIRGSNSLRGNNEPLYVVDGVIMSSAGEDAVSASTDGNTTQVNQSGLNGINPRDIESIEILKDASATAIYGSRGANGVVLITTKKGEKGKAIVNAYATTSITTVTRKLDVLDGADWARYQNEADLNNGFNTSFQIEGNNIYTITYPVSGPVIGTEPAEIIDWQDELIETARDFNAGISFRGGGDEGNYYVSAGYNDQGGLVSGARFQNGDVRINLNQNLNQNLVLNGTVSAYYAEGSFAQDGDRAGGGNRSFINNMITFQPIVFGDLDILVDEDDQLTSPYSWINDFKDVSEETRLIGRLALTYTLPFEGLSYELSAGGNIRTKERRRFYGLSTFKGGLVNGELAISELRSSSYQINNLIKYNNKISKNHRVNVVLGFTIDGRNVENDVYEVQNFATTNFTVDQPFFGQIISQPLKTFYQPTDILSTLGRVNYTFRNKYVLTASFRYDGVSKFQEGNKWSLFPSFALAWRAGDETFVQNLNVFDELKVRAGWGQIGNQGINPFQTFANYDGILIASPGNGTSVGFVPINIANPDLIWETTEQLNIGFDFGVLESRVTGALDFYSKRTKDLLQQLALPPSAGFESLSSNRGVIGNRGVEMLLSAVVVDQKDFDLSIGANISFNRTEIKSLGIPTSTIYIDGKEQQKSFYLGDQVATGNFFKTPANVFMEGQPIGLFIGYQTDGIYQSTDTDILAGYQPGDVRFIDQNDDGLINTLDRTIIGDPNPDFVYGFNLSASYKRFSANLLFNGVKGNDIANGNLLQYAYAEGTINNILAPAYHNAWRPDRETNDYPRIGYQGERQASAISDRIIEDGSYLRLNNVTIGYDVPVDKVKAIGSLNIYIAGRNLVTLTRYSGFDPEIHSFRGNGNILGVDWVSVPNTRSITFGANITF